jgi:hypothetical protein
MARAASCPNLVKIKETGADLRQTGVFYGFFPAKTLTVLLNSRSIAFQRSNSGNRLRGATAIIDQVGSGRAPHHWHGDFSPTLERCTPLEVFPATGREVNHQ